MILNRSEQVNEEQQLIPTLKDKEEQNRKTGSDQLLESNFYLFNEFLLHKHTSYTKGFIYIGFSFLHLFLAQLKQLSGCD